MKNKIISSLLSFVVVNTAITIGASISFDPAQGELISNCPNTIDVVIETEGDEEIIGAAIDVIFDEDKIEIWSFYGSDTFNLPGSKGITIDEGRLKNAFLSLKRDNNGDHIGYKGEVVYGKMTITNKNNAQEWSLEFFYDEEYPLDNGTRVFSLIDASNLVNKNTVWKARYTFVEGDCAAIEIEWTNYLDDDFDFNEHLAGTLDNLAGQEEALLKKMGEKKDITKILYISVATLLIIIIVIILIIIAKKKKHHKKK